jgi:hypothetical protein
LAFLGPPVKYFDPFVKIEPKADKSDERSRDSITSQEETASSE